MRQRVAIIGGGISGLATAWALSSDEELRQRYDVTIYQMGHRLGGKLASGRNLDHHGRNEEHGLHVWFGFYQNTFRLARELWEEWERPDDCPFEDLWDVVRPQQTGTYGYRDPEAFELMSRWFPYSGERPGFNESVFGQPLSLMGGGIDVIRVLSIYFTEMLERTPPRTLLRFVAALRNIVASPGGDATKPRALLDAVIRKMSELLARLYGREDHATKHALALQLNGWLTMLHLSLAPLWRRSQSNRRTRHLVYTLDGLLALLRGLADPRWEIYVDGDLDRVSHLDFREWLLASGARDETLRHSVLIDATYDSAFQFVDGDVSRPSFEAGTALRYFLRLMTGHGAVAWMLNVGMGEAFIAPLYEVLRNRGVQIELFHKLTAMELSEDGGSVSRLRFERQAEVVAGSYDPLITANGFRCWTTEPDWSQLRGGDDLRDRGVDFESRWSSPTNGAEVELHAGRDFDHVVSALPLGVIASTEKDETPCADWVASQPTLRALLAHVNLVPTVAAQIWLRPSMEELGWPPDSAATVGWAQPYSIWADMSPVVAHEAWPAGGPRASLYLCGVWRTDAHRTSSSERDTKRREEARAFARLRDQLEEVGTQLDRRGPDSFDWSLLYDADDREGAERVLGQFVRVNVEPSDLCDSAVPGTARLRPYAHQSGLDNLALAGTWCRTSVNTTAVEAAVMSGLAAARALGVEGLQIVGEDFMCRAPEIELIPSARRFANTNEDADGGHTDHEIEDHRRRRSAGREKRRLLHRAFRRRRDTPQSR